MLTDLEAVDVREIETQVAIVGSGPAGLTVARGLAAEGIDVVVLEAGRDDFDEGIQDEYRGDVVGLPYTRGLDGSRLRMLGGTTNHWTGWCRPLDPEDLTPREDIGRPGWPIGYDDLAGFYPEAAKVIGLTVSPVDVAGLPSEVTLPAPVGDRLRPAYVVWRATRFKETVAADLAATDGVRIFLNAPVRSVRLSADGLTVSHLDVARRSGGAVRVTAEAYVLAAGGIENARLLLVSDDVRPEGVGNATGQVGRRFAEHPHLVVGHVRMPPADKGDLEPGALTRVAEGESVVGLLATTPELLTSESIVAGSVVADRYEGIGDAPAEPLEPAVDALLTGVEGASELVRCRLVLRCEQLPNPESRVRLTSATDRLGLPRVALDWQVTATDRRSWLRLAEVAADAYGQTGRGRVRLLRDPEVVIGGGSHHLGTTAMGTDPTESVVDADGRVHDVANLWVAGSSVFPTTGWSNPTLTIVALAIRLARRLTGVVR